MNISAQAVVLSSNNLGVAQKGAVCSVKNLSTSAMEQLPAKDTTMETCMSVRRSVRLVLKYFRAKYSHDMLAQLCIFLTLNNLDSTRTTKWLDANTPWKYRIFVFYMEAQQEFELALQILCNVRYLAVQQHVGLSLINLSIEICKATQESFGFAFHDLIKLTNMEVLKGIGLSWKNSNTAMNSQAQGLALAILNISKRTINKQPNKFYSKNLITLMIMPTEEEVQLTLEIFHKLRYLAVHQGIGLSLRNLSIAMTMSARQGSGLALEILNTSRNASAQQGIVLSSKNYSTTLNVVMQQDLGLAVQNLNTETRNLSTPLRTEHIEILYPEDLKEPNEYTLEMPCSRSAKMWSDYCLRFGHSIICPYRNNCLFQNYDLCTSCSLYCLPRENHKDDCLLQESMPGEWICHLCCKTGPSYAYFNNSDFPDCKHVFCFNCAEAYREVSCDKTGYVSSETSYWDMCEMVQVENSPLVEHDLKQQDTGSVWTKILEYDKVPMLLGSWSSALEVNKIP